MPRRPLSVVEKAMEAKRQAQRDAEIGDLILQHWNDYGEGTHVVREDVIFSGKRFEAEKVRTRYEKALKAGAILAPLVDALSKSYRTSFEFRTKG